METTTTIYSMIAGNMIKVPTYQRAYSWDTPHPDSTITTQTDVFISDLEEHMNSMTTSAYYFGHFIFEKKDSDFLIIDGQQRLTTMIIFLSALFFKLKKIRTLTEDEVFYYENVIKRGSVIRFSTVDYDNQFFIDYIINKNKISAKKFETSSSRKIFQAFVYFTKIIEKKDEKYIIEMLNIIKSSTCTTHIIKKEAEAVQMFIFQNNRGKRPSNLEIVKAQFMYTIHIKSQNPDVLIKEIKERFEKIYKSISFIANNVSEDDILLYTLRVYFNSLWERNALTKINDQLLEDSALDFIQKFSDALAATFENLSLFFGKDERDNISIHSIVTLGDIGVVLPFIIKAYAYDLSTDDIVKLCISLESLVLRHRLIGTKAEIRSRMNDVFEKFTYENQSVVPIIERIEYLKKTTDWWWAYWNNDNFKASLQGRISPPTAKYLMWRYEIFLKEQGKTGYKPERYDSIINPELEHIAPRTEPTTKPHGYQRYTDKFKQEFIDCLGNYLLLSKSHNCAVGNIPFLQKIATYSKNEQQREVQLIGNKNKKWNSKLINDRKQKIIDFIRSAC